ncbi:unnamed protein product [Prunus armeniaca]
MKITLYLREIWGERLENSSRREIESLGELWTTLGEVKKLQPILLLGGGELPYIVQVGVDKVD